MKLQCSGCGDIEEGDAIRFHSKPLYANGDPCGSLMFPLGNYSAENQEPELSTVVKKGGK